MKKEKTTFFWGSEINAAILVCLLFVLLPGCAPPPEQVAEGVQKMNMGLVDLTKVNFQPRDGNWQQLNGETEVYDVTLELDGAPEDFKMAFYVKENRSWRKDPTFSRFPIVILSGHTDAQASFWLKCSAGGKLSGNVGTDNDGKAKIYLQSTGLIADVDLPNWTIDNVAPRIEHTVTCVSGPSSDPTPPPCATRNDCNAGQWCINSQCKAPPISQYCTPKRGCGDTGICMAVRNNPTQSGGMELLGRCDLGNWQQPNVECICLLY